MIVNAVVKDNCNVALNLKHVVAIGKAETTRGLYQNVGVFLVTLRCVDGECYRMEFETEDERNNSYDEILKYMEENANE